jgi:hypothetical protein
VKADNFHIVLFSTVLFASISIHWAVGIFLEQKKFGFLLQLRNLLAVWHWLQLFGYPTGLGALLVRDG